jgi:tetratricopeptide (TPR) repeat protein
MTGVGKTAFAVHAGHLLAGRFPDGQIFLALHGHTPGQRPVEPGDALASLLLMAGLPAAQIPPDVAARAALWRGRLAAKRLLLVLDDAAGSDQIRPLLPGSGGCLVLVTSRRHLSALDDAVAISLDTLPPGAANRLLSRLSGRPGLSPEDPAAEQLTRLCGYLPLAIGLIARQLHHHPSWPLPELAAELGASRDRLGLMSAENVSVAAAFDLSYADLSPDQQRLFRRLGLHPGTEIDAYAAAALDGSDLSSARRALEALYDQYLLTEPSYGRYRLHDLIREYAHGLADRVDPGEDRDRAAASVLDYYQRTAALADSALSRQPRPAPARIAQAPVTTPALANPDQALSWIRADRDNLLACLDHVTGTGQDSRVVALTAGLAALLRIDGPWAEAIARHAAAVSAAHRLGDRSGQASALTSLGNGRLPAGDYPGAMRAAEDALAIYRDIGDRLGQANALDTLGNVQLQTGDYPAGAQALTEALGIYRDIGDRLGQANALTSLGNARRLTQDHPGAIAALQEALGGYRDIGDRLGQANALIGLARDRYDTGDYPEAARAAAEALDVYRDTGYRTGQADSLDLLGEMRRITGDYPGAAEALKEALGIYRDIGYRTGQANSLTSLGDMRLQIGDYPGAALALEEALAICRDIGSRLGEACALNGLGEMRRLTEDYAGAAQAQLAAFGIFGDIGVRAGQGGSLLYLGRVRLADGDHPGAARDLAEALEILREVGDLGGEVEVLNEIATLHRVAGDLDLARSCHQQALDLARQIGSARDEAPALAGLGRCALAANRTAEAADNLRRALEIFERIGAPEAAEVAAELAALTGRVS